MILLETSFKSQLGYNVMNEYKNTNIEIIDVETKLVNSNFFPVIDQNPYRSILSKEMLDINEFESLRVWQEILTRFLKVINHDN